MCTNTTPTIFNCI